MANQITIEQALELVEFEHGLAGWQIKTVYDDIYGDVHGDVKGQVWGTIGGRQWQFVDTPKEKLKRLIEEGANKQEILKALDRLEDSDD